MTNSLFLKWKSISFAQGKLGGGGVVRPLKNIKDHFSDLKKDTILKGQPQTTLSVENKNQSKKKKNLWTFPRNHYGKSHWNFNSRGDFETSAHSRKWKGIGKVKGNYNFSFPYVVCKLPKKFSKIVVPFAHSGSGCMCTFPRQHHFITVDPNAPECCFSKVIFPENTFMWRTGNERSTG